MAEIKFMGNDVRFEVDQKHPHSQVNDRFKLDWGTYLTTSEQVRW